MIKKMTHVRSALFAALLCSVLAASALAQQDPATGPAPGSPGPLTTPPPLLLPPPTAQHHHGPPPMPLFDALDTNHDGVISAEEIANASASLKALLKNGSDHLTLDDLRPAGAPPPSPGAAAGRPEADEAGQPHPKFGAVRPHNPPPRMPEEDRAFAPEAPRMHHLAPDQEQASEDFDRPHFRLQWRREHERMLRMQEEGMDEARPQLRHERMSRHEEMSRAEDNDQRGEDARSPRPEGRREDGEQRPPFAPRPEGMNEDREAHRHAAPQPEETGSRPAQHGPPPSPLFDALDTNHDGTISAEEIANASASLKALLKNGSDHFTRDDLRPAGPPPQAGR